MKIFKKLTNVQRFSNTIDGSLTLRVALFELIWFGFPTAISFTASTLSNTIAFGFVGAHGDADVQAAHGLGYSIGNMLILTVGLGLVNGLDTLCPLVIGAGHKYRCWAHLFQALTVVAIALSILCPLIFFSEPLLILIKQDPIVARLAAHYLQAGLPGLFFVCSFEAARKFLIYHHYTCIHTVIALCAIPTQLCFLHIFVGILQQGATGAGFARSCTWFGISGTTFLYIALYRERFGWTLFKKTQEERLRPPTSLKLLLLADTHNDDIIDTHTLLPPLESINKQHLGTEGEEIELLDMLYSNDRTSSSSSSSSSQPEKKTHLDEQLSSKKQKTTKLSLHTQSPITKARAITKNTNINHQCNHDNVPQQQEKQLSFLDSNTSAYVSVSKLLRLNEEVSCKQESTINNNKINNISSNNNNHSFFLKKKVEMQKILPCNNPNHHHCSSPSVCTDENSIITATKTNCSVSSKHVLFSTHTYNDKVFPDSFTLNNNIPTAIWWKGIWAFLKIALPSAFLCVFEWVAFEAQIFMAAYLGPVELAALASSASLGSLLFIICMSVGVTLNGEIGRSMGARKPNDSLTLAKAGCVASACISVPLVIGVLSCRKWIAQLYSRTAEIESTIYRNLLLQACVVIFDSMHAVLGGEIKALNLQSIGCIFDAIGFLCIMQIVGACLAFLTSLKGVGFLLGTLAGLIFILIAYSTLLFHFTNWKKKSKELASTAPPTIEFFHSSSPSVNIISPVLTTATTPVALAATTAPAFISASPSSATTVNTTTNLVNRL